MSHFYPVLLFLTPFQKATRNSHATFKSPESMLFEMKGKGDADHVSLESPSSLTASHDWLDMAPAPNSSATAHPIGASSIDGGGLQVSTIILTMDESKLIFLDSKFQDSHRKTSFIACAKNWPLVAILTTFW